MDNKDALRERVADLEKENADWLKAIAFLRQTKADLTAENEALREANRWIPVSERLPENTNLVIIFDRFRKLGQYISSTNGWYDEDSNLEFPNENVTHWQPLPAKPKDET